MDKPMIFISYSRKDTEFVRRLASDLEQAGYDPWWDVADIRGGQEWEEEIEKHVRACAAMVVVLSPDSNNSEWVGKETLLAIELKKAIIPVMCRESKLPFRLVNRQSVDFRSNYADGLQALYEALSEAVPLEAPPPPPPPPPKQNRKMLTTIAVVMIIVLGGLVLSFLLRPAPSTPVPPTPSPESSAPAQPTISPKPTEPDVAGTAVAAQQTQAATTATEDARRNAVRAAATVGAQQTESAATAVMAATATEAARWSAVLAAATVSAQQTVLAATATEAARRIAPSATATEAAPRAVVTRGTTHLVGQQSFDFLTGAQSQVGTLSGGDLYVSLVNPQSDSCAGADSFWANNTPQRGGVDLGVLAEGDLSQVQIPTSEDAYSSQCVRIVENHVYAYLQNQKGLVVVFRVLNHQDGESIDLEYVVTADTAQQTQGRLTVVTGNNGTENKPVLELSGSFPDSPYRLVLDKPDDLRPGQTDVYSFSVPAQFCAIKGFSVSKPANPDSEDDWYLKEIYLSLDNVEVFFDRVANQLMTSTSYPYSGSWTGTQDYMQRCGG